MPDDGGWLIREDFEKIVRDHIMKPSPFGQTPFYTFPRTKWTKRDRLRVKWSHLRWRVGHWIAGYDCDDDA